VLVAGAAADEVVVDIIAGNVPYVYGYDAGCNVTTERGWPVADVQVADRGAAENRLSRDGSVPEAGDVPLFSRNRRRGICGGSACVLLCRELAVQVLWLQ
jgi:hypothetical protein